MDNFWENETYPDLAHFASTGEVAEREMDNAKRLVLPFKPAELEVLKIIAEYSAIGVTITTKKITDIYNDGRDWDGLVEENNIRKLKSNVAKVIKKHNLPYSIRNMKKGYYLERNTNEEGSV